MNSNTFEKGAALAYYTVFSLIPMGVILISIFGLIWGEQAVNGELHQSLSSALGEGPAEQIQALLKEQHKNGTGIVGAILGFLTLALSATGMFNQLHSSFNSIWQLQPQKSAIITYLSKHITSFLILLTFGFILFSSTAIHSFLTTHSSQLPEAYRSLVLIENIISFILLAIGFAAVFRFVGDLPMKWKMAFETGLVTTILFMIGKWVIGWYIGRSHIESTFGAASVLALVMVWVYYTSQIIFLGASYGYVRTQKKH